MFVAHETILPELLQKGEDKAGTDLLPYRLLEPTHYAVAVTRALIKKSW